METVLEGIVVHGKGLGRTVGMPTANLQLEKGIAFPAEGVWASFVTLGGETFLGVTNVGRRPTVDTEERCTVETNILDFDRDIYGERLRVTLEAFLRPTVKMDSLSAVKAQVEKDKEEARRILGAMQHNWTEPATGFNIASL